MSRAMAIFALAFIALALVQLLFPGSIMEVLCAVVVGFGNLFVLTLSILVWGAIYTFPMAMIALFGAGVRIPGQWRAQVLVSVIVWALSLVLFAAVQFPAHLWMSWQLADIRHEFREKSGGVAYSCEVHWPSIDRRNALLLRQGYTMYGWWEVSGDVWYDESHKPDSCNVSTGATYLFTWWSGSVPGRFDATR